MKSIPFYKRGWFRYAAAASVIIIAGLGFWFSGNEKTNSRPEAQHLAQKEVPPGKDGAILTLADGTTVVLDSMGNGMVAREKGSMVVLENGRITYYSEPTGIEILYNTMTTPRGRQFNVTLPDGTRVWLNAASSSVIRPRSAAMKEKWK